MPRVFVSQNIKGDSVSITDAEQIHHLRDVLRLKAGDEVIIVDNEGNEYVTAIEGWEKKLALFRIKEKRTAIQQKLRITVACAIPKKSRMDEIIDKLTQLGVDEIIPMKTERVITRLDEKEETRLERWRRISRSAAEQSQRTFLPSIDRVKDLDQVLSLAEGYDLKLLPTLSAESCYLNRIELPRATARVLVLVGPEGDFTPQEINQAKEHGFIPVSLGNTVLRVETAAIAITAYLRIASL